MTQPNTATGDQIELTQIARGKYAADVVKTDNRGRREGSLGRYIFATIDHAIMAADTARDTAPGTDGRPVIYIGDTASKHYYRSHTTDEIPHPVLDALDDHGLTLVEGVAGGWASWGGRPEFSTSYVDFADAEVVETER